MPILSFLSSNLGRPLAAILAVTAVALATQHYYVPHGLPKLPPQIDIGVVVLFVPICALTLGLIVEALHLVWSRTMPEDIMPMARAIPHWQDSEDA